MELKDILTKIAPTVATALGSPVAGVAVELLQQAFGISDKDQLDAKLSNMSSDDILKLKQAEIDLQVKLKQLDIDLFATEVKDRDSARQMQTSTKDMTPTILAYAITLGFFGLLAVMMFVSLPVSTMQIVNILVGSLGASWGSVISFYFGSTAGSKMKTELLAKADAIKN